MRAAPLARRRARCTGVELRGSANAASSPGRMRRAPTQHAMRLERGLERREIEVVAPRAVRHRSRQSASAGAATSLAGLPRQREPAGVISPFIRKASASRWVPSLMVTP